MLAYGKQSINQDDIDAVVNILKGDFLTTGPAVAQFEGALARYCRAAEAVAVSSGTAALHIAMLALGIGPEDTVLVPAITFAATANAARYCGAHVAFVDIDPRTGCMDPAALETRLRACYADGARPKLVVPVHFGGHPCDMAAISAIAQAHKLLVLEDACHALGAAFADGETTARVGDCRYSSATVFSFHPVKHITTGEGGAITTQHHAFAARLRSLRSHGIVRDEAYEAPDQALDAAGKPNPWYAEMRELGYNYRLTDIQCALGTSQLRRMDTFVAQRRQLAASYRNVLGSIPGDRIRMLQEVSSVQSSYHLCAVQIDFARAGISRGDLMRHLSRQGIGTQVHYLPVYRHPYYRSLYGDVKDGFPEAEKYYAQALSLPLYYDLAEADVTRVCDELAKTLVA